MGHDSPLNMKERHGAGVALLRPDDPVYMISPYHHIFVNASQFKTMALTYPGVAVDITFSNWYP
jgi:hypothetical protein